MTRIPVIDVLRGLAAIAVAWFHLTNTYEWSWLRHSGAYGWLGVDVFFVLSGFVIPFALARLYPQYSVSDFPNFLLRRFVRLEPPYILSLILVIGLWHLSAAVPAFRGAQPDYELARLTSHLVYIIPFTKYAWLQPVYWTLAYEFAFYLIMGASFPLLFKRPGAIKLVGTAVVAATMAFLGTLPSISLLFLLGIALFYHLEYASGGAGSRLAAPIVVSLVLAAMIVLDSLVTVTAGLVATLAIYLGRSFSFDQPLYRPLLGLGAISYSLYLVHVPVGGRVVNLGRRFVSGPWQELALSLIALAASIAFAVVVWVLIEKPSMRLARRLTAKAKEIDACLGTATAERILP